MVLLKVKCVHCGFKSTPLRNKFCRRCNKILPGIDARTPLTKELFCPRSSVQESTLTKVLRKREEDLKREEALKLQLQRDLEGEDDEDGENSQDPPPPAPESALAPASASAPAPASAPDSVPAPASAPVPASAPAPAPPSPRPSTSQGIFETSFFKCILPEVFPPVELLEPEVTKKVTEKEPLYENYTSEDKSVCLWQNRDEDLKELVKGSMTGFYTLVQCRSVRIGSYKVIPHEKVILSTVGLWICIPSIWNPEYKITLTIDIFEIKKVLAFYSKPAVLFVYVIPSAVERIRTLLDMTTAEGPYFDPKSSDETQKRIVLLCMPLHVDTIKAIKKIFGFLKLLEELNPAESNDLLVRSSPLYAPFHSDKISPFIRFQHCTS